MSNEVFANNNEVSCKSGDGKVIAAFPDVCLSPPSPPAGPVPIPYPVSSFSSDATNGSKTVKINGKEIMLKDQSYFSKCTGDEPATRSLGMGVVTHTITGKVYFAAWSMDVKVEGLNVDRHLDLTTSNHMSQPGNTPTIPEMEGMTIPENMEPCKCKYNRKKKAPKTPNTSQKKHVNQPGAKCWRCGSSKGNFIADHQPSLVQRWYKGNGADATAGCHDSKFAKNATSTPGDPEGSKEYQELRSRCKECYRNVYTGFGGHPEGKVLNEGLMERSKSLNFQEQLRKNFNVEVQEC